VILKLLNLMLNQILKKATTSLVSIQKRNMRLHEYQAM